jgi:hypothetical protein
MSAILNFVSSGYALQHESAAGAQAVNEVGRLAGLAADLMRVKSNEPTAAGASSNRRTSFAQMLRTRAASGSG